ncbi:MAG: glycosyltransferase family 4 protein [candidate division WOR-3 bacterium]
MKVMFGTFSAATILGGGVRVQVNSLARELRKLDVEVELFDPWKDYQLKEYNLFHLFGAHVGTYHLGRAVKSLGMKLVLSPVFYSRRSARSVASFVAVSKRLRKRGGFWTEHMFCKELCDMADLVLPNTRAEADMMTGAFGVPAAKLGLLPNGVDERFYYASPDEFVSRYGLRDFILYTGHIGWGRKNVLALLNAVRGIDRPLVLIGGVIHNDYGRRCLELVRELPGAIHIPALPADSTILASAYAACDTVVLPSFYETPGLSALEAGLAGAKVCITKHGGTTEYFGEHATYLEPSSVESIRQALVESIAKPKTEALRELIRQRFLWGEAAKVLAAAYKRLTAEQA